MGAEDDDMSNALMNDMADALRSAGLGSMLGTEEPIEETESIHDEEEESIEEAEEDTDSVVEELSLEEQVQSLIEEGEYKSRTNAP